ncbi:hypothetical protein HDU97_007201 [Phlyctochytrium planicorne]|nr:hypothetical protein HDU97_007201 [Phlyctochytrium planicorne]
MKSLNMLSRSSLLSSTTVLPFDATGSMPSLAEGGGSREKILVHPRGGDFVPSQSELDLGSEEDVNARHAIATLLQSDEDINRSIPFNITLSQGSLAAAFEKGNPDQYGGSAEGISLDGSRETFKSNAFGLGQLAQQLFETVGESLDMAPLLRDVVPWLPLDDTERTLKIGKHARHDLLKELLVRLIKGISEQVFLVLALDEIQWFDSLSFDLLVSLARSCPNVFFILSVETSKERAEELKKITDLSWAIHVKVAPHKVNDCREYLTWKYRTRDNGVAVINLDASEFLAKRAGGNPLYIDIFSDVIRTNPALEEFFVATRPLGISDLKEMERLLPRTLGAAITMLYGSLDHRFQYLLKAGSVFGESFDLEAIATIVEPKCSVRDLKGWIEAFDKFSFLKAYDDAINNWDGRYSFRHSLIRTSIYESIPVRRRRELHMGLLQYFEDQISIDQSEILPLICFHASRTDDIEKQRHYLEKFYELCHNRWMLPECAQALESLISVGQMKDVKNIECLSKWWANLSYIQTHQGKPKDALQSAKRALELIGVAWPHSNREYRVAIFRQSFKQMALWTLSGRGEKVRKGQSDPKKKYQTYVLSKVAETLPEMFHSLTTTNESDKYLSVLLCINQSLKMLKESPSDFAKACARVAHYLYFSNRKSSGQKYLKRAWQLLSVVQDSYPSYYLISQILEMEGYFDQALSIAETFGDQVFIRKMLVSIAYSHLDQADFAQVRENCQKVFSLSFTEDDHLSRSLSLSASMMSSVFVDDFEAARAEARALSETLPKVGTTRRAIFLASLTLFYVRAGEFQTALRVLSEMTNLCEKFPSQSLISMKVSYLELASSKSKQVISITSVIPFLLLTEWRSLNRHYLISIVSKFLQLNENAWGKISKEATFCSYRYQSALALLKSNIRKAREYHLTGMAKARSSRCASPLTLVLNAAIACRYSDFFGVKQEEKDKLLREIDRSGAMALHRWAGGELFSKVVTTD